MSDAEVDAFEAFDGVSQDRVTERCKVLVDAELVEREDRDIEFGRTETYWSVTMWGRLYPREEIDPGLKVPELGL